MSQPILLREPTPPVTGSPGLTQGVYGDAGNLELLVPAREGGMWVFWWNADPEDHQQGAAQGEWSGGLHLFAGHPVGVARISQVILGPRYLEVLAVSDGQLYRLYWAPETGFVEQGVIHADIVDVTAPVETVRGLEALAVRAEGSVLHLRGDASAYPRITWRTEPFRAAARAAAVRAGRDGLEAATVDTTGKAGLWRRAAAGWHPVAELAGRWGEVSLPAATAARRHMSALASPVLVRDDGGGVAVASFGGASGPQPLEDWGPVDALTTAATDLGGGRIDVVMRRGTELLHAHLTSLDDGASWRASTPTLIMSTLWTTDPGAAVHRRSFG